MANIFFDCDGVLVGARRHEEAFHQGFLAPWGFAYGAEEQVTRFNGTSLRDVMAMLQADYQARTGSRLGADFFEAGIEYYTQVSNDNFYVLGGVPEIVASVFEAGHALSITSNSSSDRLTYKLARARLASYFEERVFSAEQVERPKPAKDLILHALDQTGAQPENTILVGDSRADVLAGKAAGVKVIGTTMDYVGFPKLGLELSRLGADVVVSSADELGIVLNQMAGEIDTPETFPAGG